MKQDFKVRDLGQCKLAVRSDLVWTPQASAAGTYYMVEDLLNSKFYRVGTSEYAFLSLLDGNTTVREALHLTATADPNAALSEREAATICEWLLKNGLVPSSPSSEPPGDAEQSGQPPAWVRWNPLGFRVPLMHPDRLFEAVLPWLGWILTPWAFAAWLVLAVTAIYQVTCHWTRFVTSFDGVFAPMNWLWLPLCWFALKLVHEFAHGFACKRFGGTVREAGAIFILLLPVTYVDITSSWRFRSKYHRMLTAAAGMYAELLVASLATLAWSYSGPGLWNSLCFNLILMASLTTLVFNANCLMKFDGYYVLSDLLEIPNLYTLAQKYLASVLLRSLVRSGAPLPSLPRSLAKKLFVLGYGLATFCWKIAVCGCMLLAATSLLHGAGIVLAAIAAGLWCGVPLFRFISGAVRSRQFGGGTGVWSYLAAGSGTLAVALLLSVVPWPGMPRAPVIVQYSPLVVIRADCPGFVSEICVHSGCPVEAGQVLAILENEELENELSDLRLSVEQAEIKSRVYEHNHEMAAWQAELKTLDSLRTKYREKQAQVEKLTVRAPASGTAIADNLSTLLGTYLHAGDEILSIGSEGRKELQAAISEEDLSPFKATVGEMLYVRLSGGDTFHCRLEDITPRANLTCPHPALSAACGGPLAVKATSASRHDPGDGHDADREHDLLVPHFLGIVQLSREQSLQLRVGQVGTVAVGSHREAFAAHLYRSASRWIREKLDRTRS